MDRGPFISIIVPVHNRETYLNRCLDALITSYYRSFEIIVVDDASSDASAQIGRQKGALVLRLPHNSGPAAARNHGSQKAQGDILFFVDSDVLVGRETVAHVATHFSENHDVDALFGSYDEDPVEKNFLSQYKNLYHHFVHQKSSNDGVTFWAGCGAIRRDVFHSVGGFDAEKYPTSSIEDIELGYRLRRMGYRIILDKKLQVRHLKKWNFAQLLRTDIFYRAVPWSRLMLESRQMVSDLNLQMSDRISAALVGLAVGIFPFLLLESQLLFIILFLLAIVFILNHKLYGFFLNRRGLKFAALAFPLHLFYYLYSGATFVVCWCMYMFLGKRSNTAS